MDKMWKNSRLRILILTFSFEKQQRLCFNETCPRTVLYVSGCGLDLSGKVEQLGELGTRLLDTVWYRLILWMACLSTRLIPRPTAASETKKLSTFDLSDGRGNRWTTPRFQTRTHSDVSDLHSYSG